MVKSKAPTGEPSPFNVLEDSRDTPEHNHASVKEEGFDVIDRDEVSGDESEGSNGSESSIESRRPIDKSVMEDMVKFEESFKGITQRFRLINRIGEGTFSTVYKAEDLLYEHYYNDWDIDSPDAAVWVSPPVKEGTSSSPGKHKGPRYVAIKKIYVTSSPIRIQNELELLNDLKWCKSICPLITAFRCQDQVVAEFFREMLPEDMQVYFRSLFRALAAVHKHGILHRDIKPTNFLYDIYRNRGVLVDFGLAEREGTETSYCLCSETSSRRRAKIESSYAARNPSTQGYSKNDQRPSRRANRAGTRGFRAPEVLLKCTEQSTKIDIWSAGVILLTILSGRFPFFNSTDDVEAMIEIATIWGQRKMKACALLHGSVFECTIPTIGEKGFTLEKIVLWSTCRSRESKDGQETLSPGEKQAIAFLERCLELDPRKRISAQEALEHDFLAEGTPPELSEDEMEVIGGDGC
ncbi:MAG: hypothetical protein Q9187_001367 [Circinaria calcarea]